MEISAQTLQEINNLITTSDYIVVFNHMNPDGDTIGASLAVYNMLVDLQKNVTVISPNEFPDFLSWLHGADKIKIYSNQEEECKKIISQSNLYIYIDFNKLNRTGDIEQFLLTQTKPSILIDHHPDPDYFANIVLSDPTASSASELVYSIFSQAGFDANIKEKSAEAIYCGILTDTGRFNHNSSKPATFRIVASLLERNINKDLIHERIFNVNSFEKLQLMGKILSTNFVYLPQFNAAYIYISIDDQKKYNFQPGDSEGFVNYPLTIKGVRFCAMFTENESQTKVSLRSKGSFPTNKFSQDYFNGGGHLNASGGRTSTSLKDAIKIFINGLEDYKELLLN